ncbi:MAG: hypothetical protein M3417_05345 [Actinomycetota bacterium]|nr:hypothetical protein [Actinomycetota bacterium]
MSARAFMLAGSSVRLAYGIGSLVAPDWMSGRLAPDVRGHADGRMSLRGFGGLYIAVALLTIVASYRTDIARPALALNLACETFDAAAGLLEVRDRGGPDPIALGGIAMPLAGALTWTAALRRL